MEPSEEYAGTVGDSVPGVDGALLLPLFRLAKKLPEHLHTASFSVSYDKWNGQVVLTMGTVTLRECATAFPSDTIIAQMILVLP
jgi:hypothetical protein